MTRDNSLHHSFEKFVRRLLTLHGIQVKPASSRSLSETNFDFLAINSGGSTAVVETKLYQSLKITFNAWRRMFAQLEAAQLQRAVNYGILVTNAQFPTPMQVEVPSQLIVWDYNAVSQLASASPQMTEEWERICQEGFIYRSEPLPQAKQVQLKFVESLATADAATSAMPPLRGSELSLRLQSTKAGKGKNATAFEQACIEALQYAFKDDLINWSPQKASHAQLHRYDVIARISSQNDFWNSLVADHRARYIIFEFKNYSGQITQAEIYSTEKYLFPQAMRSTGIIVSRKGANKNAIRVMHGAFREAGKLILSITIDQVNDMLNRRDSGDDPSSVLADAIEDTLVGLER